MNKQKGGEVNSRGLLELLHALTLEVCKPHDFLLQSHTAVSLSIALGFVRPFEALQTFFVHGAINSYLWMILEIFVHLQHWNLKISYLLQYIGFLEQPVELQQISSYGSRWWQELTLLLIWTC